MQFVTEIAAPWSRKLTTLSAVQASAAGTGEPGKSITLPDSTEVERLILAASAMIEHHIRRPKMLLQGQYREYIAGPGGPTIMLSVTPVIAVSGITLRGQSLTEDWTLDPTTGILFRPDGWEYTGYSNRDIDDTRLPGPGRPEFVVDYYAGYNPPELGNLDPVLPADIEQAAIVTVLQWVQTQTQNLTIQRTRIGDFTQTFFAGTSNVGGVRGLPIPVIDMLQPYVRMD